MSHSYFRLVILIVVIFINAKCASQTCNGFLLIMQDSDTLIIDFQNTPFTIEQIPIQDSVYDDSIVRFTAHSTNGKTIFNYDTYVAANLLTINLNNIQYSIGSFDGAADTSIPNLTQTHCIEGQNEYNCIIINAPLNLTTENYRFSQSLPPSDSPDNNQSITLLTGSTLVWWIKNNN